MTGTPAPSPTRCRRLIGSIVLIGLVLLAPLDRSYADTPSPTPTPAATPTPELTPNSTPKPDESTTSEPSSAEPSSAEPSSAEPSRVEPSTPTADTTTASPSPSLTPTASPSPTPAPSASSRSAASRQAAAAPSLTLAVSSVGGPVARAFYEDLGSYRFSGAVDGVGDGAKVEIFRRTATTGYARVTAATVAGGRFSASAKVTGAGKFTFRATTPGDANFDLVSNTVTVTVANSRIVLNRPASKIDSLKNPTITGSIVPARKGVQVNVNVKIGKKYLARATTRTNAAGRFSTSLGYGRGAIASYSIRAGYPAVNRKRWEVSGAATYARVAVISARVTSTTAAEVAKTYRAGCPVGRSRLKTVSMNFYGRDKRMHRGVIIVRSDLTTEVIRGFTNALNHRYPVAKMNNPNAYGGNDPRQMEANNTSGFNCRKVVGNPYRQSPHSYGIAIDVNTVQNPYRDANGRWWPKNGKSYIDRTPRRLGMLTYNSSLTASLRKDRFFWGGQWNPGRDYQHFEYRG